MYQQPYGYPPAGWPQQNPYGQQQGVAANPYAGAPQAAAPSTVGQQQGASAMHGQQQAQFSSTQQVSQVYIYI